jgi:hypothetical protein
MTAHFDVTLPQIKVLDSTMAYRKAGDREAPVALFRLALVVALVTCAIAAGRYTPAAQKPNSVLAFEHLSSLVGEWQGVENASEARLIYTLTADGSALMEDFRAPKDEMITMFTVDGDHLIATHYCSMGNQPQMITGPIKEPLSSLVFSLSRVTGMKTPDDWHNTGLTLTLEDKQHLTQVWTYEYKGQKGTNTFRFIRRREEQHEFATVAPRRVRLKNPVLR